MLDVAKGDDDRTGYRAISLQSDIRSTMEVLSFSLCRRKWQSLVNQSSEEKTASCRRNDEDGEAKPDGDEEEGDILPEESETNAFRLHAPETKW